MAGMKYATIVADPPWHYEFGKRTHSDKGWDRLDGEPIAPLPYSTMTVDEIALLPVRDFADKAAHLYLWTTYAYLEDAYDIARYWGFRPSTLLTWCKPPNGIGLGGTYSLTTEYVLFARRGVLPAIRRLDTTWFQWPRGAHSAKPEAFLDLVESVSPPPRLELFARRARFGWDYWGDESLGTAEISA